MNFANVQTLMVTSKQDLFERKGKYKALSIGDDMGEVTQKVGHTAVFILTSFDLYIFHWFLLLAYVISN